jgi:predicted dehydrogenase
MAMRNKPIKIGLIGCGNVTANRHLPVLKGISEAKVVAAADRDQSRLDHISRQFGIERRYSEYAALLEDASVDAVGIFVPLKAHFEIAMAALDAGKHLLIEKPLTLTLDEADQLVERAERTDSKSMVAFNKRWHRLVRLAGRLIKEGVLGSVSMMHSTISTAHDKDRLPDWRRRREEGGGTLIELGSHYFDLWHFLLNCHVEEIYAVSGSTEAMDDEPGIVTARTSDGVFLNCLLSDLLPDQNKIEIFGENCLLNINLHRFDGIELIPLHGHGGDVKHRLRNLATFLRSLPRGILQFHHGGDYQDSFRDLWIHFLNCISGDKPVDCPLEEGRRSLRVALAAVRSVTTGRPVRIVEANR